MIYSWLGACLSSQLIVGPLRRLLNFVDVGRTSVRTNRRLTVFCTNPQRLLNNESNQTKLSLFNMWLLPQQNICTYMNYSNQVFQTVSNYVLDIPGSNQRQAHYTVPEESYDVRPRPLKVELAFISASVERGHGSGETRGQLPCSASRQAVGRGYGGREYPLTRKGQSKPLKSSLE